MIEDVITKTAEYVKSEMSNEGTGHDWYHVNRVWKTSKYIGKKEGANLFIVENAALLHDLKDWKFNGGDTSVGSKEARSWLEKLNVQEEDISHICDIIENISFKGANVDNNITTKEEMVVYDADKLDSIGAIAIARIFTYGGHFNRPIYDPNIKVKLHNSPEEFLNAKSTSVNHFYEKVLLLKDRMYTETGRQIAESRHKYMEDFLKQFHKEWNLEDIK